MSDHISTEEAERVANALNRFTFEMPSYPECERARVEAMSALRSLAAERDELMAALHKITVIREVDVNGEYITTEHIRGYEACNIARAALGENQP